ncbi:protein of unknown function [Kyrpidia spormannii]|uniref:Uncharacterized protein n=1 Tax=Kyrpidia spormannii TaxID=2055160 RepID=A0A6F9E5G6_9BACL|nr:protein of unknown function [Kyrpidia spormannii]
MFRVATEKYLVLKLTLCGLMLDFC